MGYYTDYTLSYICHPALVGPIKEEIKKFDEGFIYDGGDEDDFFNPPEEDKNGNIKVYGFFPEKKWYDYEDDMYKISRTFPSVRFDITGSGEESYDLWASTWINGKCHWRPAEIAPFDETKLEEYTPLTKQNFEVYELPDAVCGDVDSESKVDFSMLE